MRNSKGFLEPDEQEVLRRVRHLRNAAKYYVELANTGKIGDKEFNWSLVDLVCSSVTEYGFLTTHPEYELIFWISNEYMNGLDGTDVFDHLFGYVSAMVGDDFRVRLYPGYLNSDSLFLIDTSVVVESIDVFPIDLFDRVKNKSGATVNRYYGFTCEMLADYLEHESKERHASPPTDPDSLIYQKALNMWNDRSDTSWEIITNELDQIGPKAFSQAVKRYAKKTNQFIRQGSPGSKRKRNSE